MFSPNYWRVLCSALRTDVFRQTVGGPVFSPNYWRVLCSASTDIRFPPNSWRPCVLRQSLRPIKKHRLLTKLYDWSLNSHADAVFAKTQGQISTRVGRVVERIVPLHHAERRGKSIGQSFARMFCNSNSAFFGSSAEPPPPWLHIVPLKTQNLKYSHLHSCARLIPRPPHRPRTSGSTVRGE